MPEVKGRKVNRVVNEDDEKPVTLALIKGASHTSHAKTPFAANCCEDDRGRGSPLAAKGTSHASSSDKEESKHERTTNVPVESKSASHTHDVSVNVTSYAPGKLPGTGELDSSALL
jgi:hypothetical protein